MRSEETITDTCLKHPNDSLLKDEDVEYCAKCVLEDIEKIQVVPRKDMAYFVLLILNFLFILQLFFSWKFGSF